jgi:hypothetical protein
MKKKRSVKFNNLCEINDFHPRDITGSDKAGTEFPGNFPMVTGHKVLLKEAEDAEE